MFSFLATLANALLPAEISSLISSYYSTPLTEPFSDPTLAQVEEVRSILMTTPRHGLPAELAELIIDFAEYWPVTRTKIDLELKVFAGWSPTPMTFLYLETPPLGIPLHEKMIGKPRKVVFKTSSRDQGWADNHDLHGSYNGSFAWFDVSIFRKSESATVQGNLSPSQTLLESVGSSTGTSADMFQVPEEEQTQFYGEQCNIADLERRLQVRGWNFVKQDSTQDDESEKVDWLLQRNVVAGQELKEHIIEWRDNDDDGDDGDQVDEAWPVNGAGNGTGFVRSLRRGDVIGVWARALYGGWRNEVAEVEITVYYSL